MMVCVHFKMWLRKLNYLKIGNLFRNLNLKMFHSYIHKAKIIKNKLNLSSK